jgi:hypothetical protein
MTLAGRFSAWVSKGISERPVNLDLVALDRDLRLSDEQTCPWLVSARNRIIPPAIGGAWATSRTTCSVAALGSRPAAPHGQPCELMLCQMRSMSYGARWAMENGSLSAVRLTVCPTSIPISRRLRPTCGMSRRRITHKTYFRRFANRTGARRDEGIAQARENGRREGLGGDILGLDLAVRRPAGREKREADSSASATRTIASCLRDDATGRCAKSTSDTSGVAIGTEERCCMGAAIPCAA